MIGGQIVPTHAMAKQLPLSQDVLWTQRSPVVRSICLSGLLRRLRLAMIDRHVSLLHAPKKNVMQLGCRLIDCMVVVPAPVVRLPDFPVCALWP